MTVTYLSRRDWGAGDHRAGYPQDPTSKVGLAIHHTVMAFGEPGNLEAVRRYMRQLQTARPDLGGEVPYNFVVFPGATDQDGIVAEGRGRAWSGAHTVDYNTSRLGVAFAGNTDVDPITEGIIEAFLWIGRTQLVAPERAQPTFGHRDVKSTACPGAHLYDRLDEIQPPFAARAQEDLSIMDDATKKYLDQQFEDIDKRFKRRREAEIRILTGQRKILENQRRDREAAGATLVELREIDSAIDDIVVMVTVLGKDD